MQRRFLPVRQPARDVAAVGLIPTSPVSGRRISALQMTATLTPNVAVIWRTAVPSTAAAPS